MPRMARVVIPGVPHHVTQRGNRHQYVFFSDADRRLYLDYLGDYSADHGLEILAYCLMTNHLHLVAIPADAESLSQALRPVHLRYAQQVNRRLGQSGFVWQGRFYSCPLDESHAWAAVRYVERNPVRAGLVPRAEDYPWSSARGHCRLRNDPLLSRNLELADEVADWSAWLQEDDDPGVLAQLRQRTRTGRPAGDDTFIAKLESLLGRTVRPRKPGRPRKRPKTG